MESVDGKLIISKENKRFANKLLIPISAFFLLGGAFKYRDLITVISCSIFFALIILVQILNYYIERFQHYNLIGLTLFFFGSSYLWLLRLIMIYYEDTVTIIIYMLLFLIAYLSKILLISYLTGGKISKFKNSSNPKNKIRAFFINPVSSGVSIPFIIGIIGFYFLKSFNKDSLDYFIMSITALLLSDVCIISQFKNLRKIKVFKEIGKLNNYKGN